MPRMDGTGPEGRGAGTGRRLGNCRASERKDESVKIGQGMGMRRRAGGGQGQGRRLQSGK